MVHCGIIGATGYAGAELARILQAHPHVSGMTLCSSSQEGTSLVSVYPNLRGSRLDPLTFVDRKTAVTESDVVFSALPHGHAGEIAAECDAAGKLFIDLSADFRFGMDAETYTAWYGKPAAGSLLREKAVYGLPELNREAIKKAKIIGNPGCYPTASSLGLYPALSKGLVAEGTIIIDAASGVTGAGREPSRGTHYPEVADTLLAYKIGEHRHSPEIVRVLSAMAGRAVDAVFTPHLAPIGRGIVATVYFPLKDGVDAKSLRDAYVCFYECERFVRVQEPGMAASNRNVRFSNFCDISVHMAANGKMGIVVSAIDNMVKGAAGQAVQNMNIALGMPEDSGISMQPPAF